MLQKGQANQAVEEISESKPTGGHLEIESLERELREKEAQVRELIRDTLDAQEAERERICLEVHDGVTQTLASAFQYLQALETTSLEGTSARQLLLRASALVKQAIQESREVINSLQPATLRDLGLVTTLRHEMRQLEQETRWKIDFKADAIRLPQDVETGLYRIIHEAITNTRKHADTKRLRVRITLVAEQVKVEVRDWGVGFNYNPQDMSRRRGTGLLSMRKRAELLQGACDIQSTPGEGTTIRIEIPFSHYRE
jgi:signal transduction histidine kinase